MEEINNNESYNDELNDDESYNDDDDDDIYGGVNNVKTNNEKKNKMCDKLKKYYDNNILFLKDNKNLYIEYTAEDEFNVEDINFNKVKDEISENLFYICNKKFKLEEIIQDNIEINYNKINKDKIHNILSTILTNGGKGARYTAPIYTTITILQLLNKDINNLKLWSKENINNKVLTDKINEINYIDIMDRIDYFLNIKINNEIKKNINNQLITISKYISDNKDEYIKIIEKYRLEFINFFIDKYNEFIEIKKELDENILPLLEGKFFKNNERVKFNYTVKKNYNIDNYEKLNTDTYIFNFQDTFYINEYDVLKEVKDPRIYILKNN
jgi:hypothetical protein